MAAMPDTHMAFQRQSAVAFWTELQDSTPAYINRGAHQYAYVRPQTRCLKAKRSFGNELSWWQILPFNWLVKEAIRIAPHRCSSQKSVWPVLSIHYVWECVLGGMTHFRRPESCHSQLWMINCESPATGVCYSWCLCALLCIQHASVCAPHFSSFASSDVLNNFYHLLICIPHATQTTLS